MSIEVSETEFCKLSVNFDAPKELVNSKYEEVVDSFKKLPVSGFRPGKASKSAIKHHYRDQITAALKKVLAEEAYHETLFQQNIKPLGNPEFTEINLFGDQFSCKFNVMKRPDVQLSDYKGFDVVKPAQVLKAEDIAQKLLQDLRMQHSETLVFTENDVVEASDSIILDYKVFDGETELTTLSTNGQLFTMGRGGLAGFDDQLIGLHLGENKRFDLVCGDNAVELIRGKNITFDVTVVMGSKTNPAPLDHTLAEKVGFDTYDNLVAHAQGVAAVRVDQANRADLLQAISASLVEKNAFQMPDWLVLAEARFVAANAKVDFDTQTEEVRKNYLELGEKNVRLALILDKVRETEPDAQLTDQEVLEMIKSFVAKSGGNLEEMMQQMQENNYLQMLAARVRDEHTLDFVAKTVNVIE